MLKGVEEKERLKTGRAPQSSLLSPTEAMVHRTQESAHLQKLPMPWACGHQVLLWLGPKSEAQDAVTVTTLSERVMEPALAGAAMQLCRGMRERCVLRVKPPIPGGSGPQCCT